MGYELLKKWGTYAAGRRGRGIQTLNSRPFVTAGVGHAVKRVVNMKTTLAFNNVILTGQARLWCGPGRGVAIYSIESRGLPRCFYLLA